MNYRLSKIGYCYGENAAIEKFTDLNDSDIDPGLLKRVFFPKKIVIDDSYTNCWEEE